MEKVEDDPPPLQGAPILHHEVHPPREAEAATKKDETGSLATESKSESSADQKSAGEVSTAEMCGRLLTGKMSPSFIERSMSSLDSLDPFRFGMFLFLLYFGMCAFVLFITSQMGVKLTSAETQIFNPEEQSKPEVIDADFFKNTADLQAAVVTPSMGVPRYNTNLSYWGQKSKPTSRMLNGQEFLEYDLKSMVKDPSEPITVYLLPHSHLDPGWIETFEVYYEQKVRNILNNVIDHLTSDPFKSEAKFTWVETSFLQRYYTDDLVSQDHKLKLKNLLQKGTIEIVGGGWVQHDEALTNYKMQIRQMETGLDWLYKTFPFLVGKVKTMFQADPFGSSGLTPLLFQTDYQYLILNRIGDEAKNLLKENQAMDFLWTSPFLEGGIPGRPYGMQTRVTFNHYSFEQHDLFDSYVQPLMNQTSFEFLKTHKEPLEMLRDLFLAPALEQQNHQHVPMFIGNDFTFFDKNQTHFLFPDYLYHLINNYGESILGVKIQAKIATPQDYFKAVEKLAHRNKINLGAFSFDLNQYDEDPRNIEFSWVKTMNKRDYWTGFFGNFGQHKALIKRAFSNLDLASTFFFLMQSDVCDNWEDSPSKSFLYQCSDYYRMRLNDDLGKIAQNVSIGAHHDSITGTFKPLVHADEKAKYVASLEKLSRAVDRQYIEYFDLKSMVPNNDASIDAIYEYLHWRGQLTSLDQVTIYNPSLYKRNGFFRLTLELATPQSRIRVLQNGKPLKLATLQQQIQSKQYDVHSSKNRQVVLFVHVPEVPPLGVSLIDVEAFVPPEGKCEDCIEFGEHKELSSLPPGFVLENDEIIARFNKKTFMVEQLHFKKLNQTLDLEMSIVRYPSANSDSGAYIFAPRNAEPETLKMVPIHATVIKSPLADKLVVFYRSVYLNAIHSMVTFSVNHLGNKHVMRVDYQVNQLPLDEIFMRFEIKKASRGDLEFDLDKSRVYMHDSIFHVRKDHIEKRYLISRDVGSKYFSAVSGFAYRFGDVEGPSLEDDYVLSFFTGNRANAVGIPRKDGKEKRVLDWQIGRHLEFDDHKGLPDGIADLDGIYQGNFNFGVFLSEEILSGEDYREAFDDLESPLLVQKQEQVIVNLDKDPSSQQQKQIKKRMEVSFATGVQPKDQVIELINVKYDSKMQKYVFKALVKHLNGQPLIAQGKPFIAQKSLIDSDEFDFLVVVKASSPLTQIKRFRPALNIDKSKLEKVFGNSYLFQTLEQDISRKLGRAIPQVEVVHGYVMRKI